MAAVSAADACVIILPPKTGGIRDYGFGCAVAAGEAAGVALPGGKTPAPESGAGDEVGDG